MLSGCMSGSVGRWGGGEGPHGGQSVSRWWVGGTNDREWGIMSDVCGRQQV